MTGKPQPVKQPRKPLVLVYVRCEACAHRGRVHNIKKEDV